MLLTWLNFVCACGMTVLLIFGTYGTYMFIRDDLKNRKD